MWAASGAGDPKLPEPLPPVLESPSSGLKRSYLALHLPGLGDG